MRQKLNADDFKRTVASGLALSPLFDHQPDVFLYVKDRDSRFVHVNDAWLKMRKFRSVAEVVGLSDFDLHPRHLAERYVAEDNVVMESGETLPNQVWLVPAGGRSLRWFLSTKTPLFAEDGSVCGLAGAMRDFEAAGEVYRPYEEMQDVLALVVRSVDRAVSVAEMAAVVGLSVGQFERKFKRLFQMTPLQYVQRVRINAAAELLATTDQSVAEIAVGCGFYDQSYFTKQFRRFMGETPLAYRRRQL